MENYIWTMIMASWTPLIIHDSYELQTSMISDHSKWGFIRFTRSMITHDCYEHWLWAITVHRNSYEFGFWTINDQTHHTWWGGINAMKCWCSYMINTDSVSYYDPYDPRDFPRALPSGNLSGLGKSFGRRGWISQYLPRLGGARIQSPPCITWTNNALSATFPNICSLEKFRGSPGPNF